MSDRRYRSFYTVTDAAGQTLLVADFPAPRPEVFGGAHVRREGQRLDHLAGRYLGDGTQWWRVAELNGVMHPEQLDLAEQIAIPWRGR